MLAMCPGLSWYKIKKHIHAVLLVATFRKSLLSRSLMCNLDRGNLWAVAISKAECMHFLILYEESPVHIAGMEYGIEFFKHMW
jgi:hypothetical protein